MGLLAAVMEIMNRSDLKRATPEMVVTLAARSEQEKEAGGNKHGNRNAVTHGAYAHVGYEDISTEAAEQIKNLAAAGAMSNLLQELQALMVRKEYLEGLLKQYTDEENQQQFYTDKGKYVPNTWIEHKPDRRFLQLSSAPLAVPHAVDSWFVAKVL